MKKSNAIILVDDNKDNNKSQCDDEINHLQEKVFG
jgi:hypothetical protein